MTNAHGSTGTPDSDGDLVYRLKRFLLALDGAGARKLVQAERLRRSPFEVVERVIAPALDDLGRGWDTGQVALSQLYMAGRLCEEMVLALLPDPAPSEASGARLAIATLDDYHMLGKRIVLAALRASGFRLADYGRQVPEGLVAKVLDEKIEVLLLSALMLPSALRVAEVKKLLDAKGANVRLVVGGAPFRLDKGLAREVGADETGANTSEAVEIVRRLTGGRP
jgi:methanogenic corrinoid protein MtbC1